METNNPSVKPQTIDEKVNSLKQVQSQNKLTLNKMKSDQGLDPEDPKTFYVPGEQLKVKH